MIKKPTHLVKFYGVKCYASLENDSIELLGKNKFTHFFLSNYSRLVYKVKDIKSFILTMLNIDHVTEFKVYIIAERRKVDEK